MSVSDEKAAMRAEVLARRNALEPVRRIELSLDACSHGAKAVEFDPGTIISGFFPIRSEIDPRPLMDKFRQMGARLCLPIVQDKVTIVFRELLRGAKLVDSGFGTRGPGEEAQILDPAILIMPLAAFDKTGGRIGYGAGHYDMAIARLVAKGLNPHCVGFAFSIQEVDNVPVEPHDQPLHAILTETGYHTIEPRG